MHSKEQQTMTPSRPQSQPQSQRRRQKSHPAAAAPYYYAAVCACCWLVASSSTSLGSMGGSNGVFASAWIPRMTTRRFERGVLPKGRVVHTPMGLEASVVPTDTFASESGSGTTAGSATIATAIHDDSPLSMTLEELATLVGGKGRAQTMWEYYRKGIDPLEQQQQSAAAALSTDDAKASLPILGASARALLNDAFPAASGGGNIQDSIARVVHQTTSADGTTKLLLQLHSDGKLQVEAVIIPWPDRGVSTLCVSSQVGCMQGCTFCQTGRMGKLRSLTTAEILAQLWAANKLCREQGIYPVDNIVFMGMGEPADNSDAVVRAAKIMTDPHGFQLAPRKVTISTVAPSPQAFTALGEAPAVLAWSLHASRDSVRRELVPTTRHSMVELRQALLAVLQKRSKRLRATMLEMTLLAGKNDSVQDAEHLADFCQPFLDDPAGIKLVVNLIPWNDIAAQSGPAANYQTPSPDALAAFQKTLMKRNILCYIRTTRGDDESAACGQLATQKRPPTGTERQ
jgi:23S rRNA (adenine2503-C2)-methyltransferase